MASALRPIRWVQIPYQVPYLHGLALQESVVARRLSAKRFLEESPGPTPALRHQPPSRAVQKAQSVALQDYLFLLEHTPVYTEGRRKGAKEAIADDEEGRRLRALGAQYIVAQRGGLITFHGPGQLVGYPILDLAQMNLSTRCYVDMMQKAFHTLLNKSYNIDTVPPPDDATGVWTDEMHKILSIGIQVRQRITSHGFALNVAAQPLLTWFSHIVACGIQGKSMTSLERQRAILIKSEEDARPDREAAPEGVSQTNSPQSPLTEIEPGLRLGPESRVAMGEVALAVAEIFGQTYKRTMEPASDADFRFLADDGQTLSRMWVGDEEVFPATSA